MEMAKETVVPTEVKAQRVRMNVSLTAKGLGQWEVTSEFPTVEESAKYLDEAIKQVREILVQNNIQEVGQA